MSKSSNQEYNKTAKSSSEISILWIVRCLDPTSIYLSKTCIKKKQLKKYESLDFFVQDFIDIAGADTFYKIFFKVGFRTCVESVAPNEIINQRQ